MIIVSSVLSMENERARRERIRLKPTKQAKPCRTQTHHRANHTSWKIKYLCSTYILLSQLLLLLLPDLFFPLICARSRWKAAKLSVLCMAGLLAQGNSNTLWGWGGPLSHRGLGPLAGLLGLWGSPVRAKCINVGLKPLPLQALPLNSSLNMLPLCIWCNFSVQDKLIYEFGLW